jgi:hypothetical protein
MGLEVTSRNTRISAEGKSRIAELSLDTSNQLGLARENDGSLSIVGDPYYTRNSKLKSYYSKLDLLTKELNTAYAIEEAVSKVEEVGFQITENLEGIIDPDGFIYITAESFA